MNYNTPAMARGNNQGSYRAQYRPDKATAKIFAYIKRITDE